MNVDYWDCEEGQDRLKHTTVDDAVEWYLDEVMPKYWPATLEVYGYQRLTVDRNDRALAAMNARTAINDLFNEEYGDPEGDSGSRDLPQEFVDASLALVDLYLRGFTVWACEKVCKETVDVLSWIREHKPRWLEDANILEWVETQEDDCDSSNS